MAEWDDDSLEVWPSFVDVLTGAVMFLLLTLVALVAQSFQLSSEQKNALQKYETLKRERQNCDAVDREAADRIVSPIAAKLDLIVSDASGSERGAECRREGDWGVKCEFSSDLTFEKNKYELSASAPGRLMPFANELRRMYREGRLEEVHVEGHTDASEFPKDSAFTNWELSSHRAGAIVHLLLNEDEQGMARHFQAVGLAQFHPRAERDGMSRTERDRWQRFVAVRLRIAGSIRDACRREVDRTHAGIDE